MRTTVTLDPDTEQIVRRLMRERKVSFKRAINDAIREGGIGGPTPQFRTETAPMGRSRVSLDRALQIAAELEDEELVRKATGGA